MRSSLCMKGEKKMNRSILLDDKKKFIRSFLKKYSLKRRECAWLLNYLLNNRDMLKQVHFVREITNCPRGIIMTTTCSEEIAFKFIKEKVVTRDAETAF